MYTTDPFLLLVRELVVQRPSSAPGSQAAAIIVGHTAENASMNYIGITFFFL